MADGTLDSELFVLFDLWPGTPTEFVPPYGTILSAEAGHNVAAAAYPLGTKIQLWQDGAVGAAGWSTFVYFNWVVNGSVAFAALQSAVIDTNANPYILTNDPDDCLDHTGGMGAICLSAVTTAYYGWGWVGGVCPESYVAALTGNFAVVDDVAIGPIVFSNLTADAIGFALPADDGTELTIGYSLAAAS